jgi:hypothetical protein
MPIVLGTRALSDAAAPGSTSRSMSKPDGRVCRCMAEPPHPIRNSDHGCKVPRQHVHLHIIDLRRFQDAGVHGVLLRRLLGQGTPRRQALSHCQVMLPGTRHPAPATPTPFSLKESEDAILCTPEVRQAQPA